MHVFVDSYKTKNILNKINVWALSVDGSPNNKISSFCTLFIDNLGIFSFAFTVSGCGFYVVISAAAKQS